MKGPHAPAPGAPFHEIGIRFAAAPGAGGLQVQVDTPAGSSEWQELALPKLDEVERLAQQALLDASRRGRGDEPARRLGRALFAALFDRQVLGRYQATLGPSRAGAPPLRLRFHLGAGSAGETTLHRLPWELLCEPGHGEGRLLALDRRLSVVRHLTVADGVTLTPKPPRLRVLVAAAEGRAPSVPPLDLGAEIEAIRAACRDQGAVAVEVLRPATLEALIARLRGGGVHVLHLIGHGDLAAADGVVLLPDTGGRLAPWHGERLAAQLDGLSPLRLVVLNACRTAEAVAGRPFAGVAGAFLARGLPAVVAMQAPISDLAAAAFAAAVFERLAAGDGLDAAVAEGRLAISRRRPRTFEWAVPVLFSRLPGGELFAAPSPTEPAGARGGSPATDGGGDAGGAAGSGGSTARRRPLPPSPRTRWLLGLVSLALLIATALLAPRFAVELPPADERIPPAARERQGESGGTAGRKDVGGAPHDDAAGERDGPAGSDAGGEVVRRPTPGESRAGATSDETGDAGPPAAPGGVGAPALSAAADRPSEPPGGGTAPGAADVAAAAAAGSFCGPVRSLRSGDPVTIPEIDAQLVPQILERPGLGTYVTVGLIGPAGETHRTANRPASLDFAGHAPLIVRLLAFDPSAGTVSLSCRIAR